MARSKKNPEGGHESVSAEPSEAPEVIEETPEVVAEVPEDLPVGAEIQVEGKVKPGGPRETRGVLVTIPVRGETGGPAGPAAPHPG